FDSGTPSKSTAAGAVESPAVGAGLLTSMATGQHDDPSYTAKNEPDPFGGQHGNPCCGRRSDQMWLNRLAWNAAHSNTEADVSAFEQALVREVSDRLQLFVRVRLVAEEDEKKQTAGTGTTVWSAEEDEKKQTTGTTVSSARSAGTVSSANVDASVGDEEKHPYTEGQNHYDFGVEGFRAQVAATVTGHSSKVMPLNIWRQIVGRYGRKNAERFLDYHFPFLAKR
ncbi:unnamed protein product, partial [Amoebophrya sp. A25]